MSRRLRAPDDKTLWDPFSTLKTELRITEVLYREFFAHVSHSKLKCFSFGSIDNSIVQKLGSPTFCRHPPNHIMSKGVCIASLQCSNVYINTGRLSGWLLCHLKQCLRLSRCKHFKAMVVRKQSSSLFSGVHLDIFFDSKLGQKLKLTTTTTRV